MGDSSVSFRAQWAQRVVRQKLYREFGKLHQEESRRHRDHGTTGVMSLEELPLFPSPGTLFSVAPSSPFDLPPDTQQPQSQPDGLQNGQPDKGLLHLAPQQDHRICIVGAGVTGLYIAMILDSLEVPGLTYEILEGSDRTGGRLYTHYFSEVPHDYYDIGAMRFPKIDIMKRTFDLFERLNIPLIPYYLNHTSTKPPAPGSEKCPTMYNDITVIDGEDPGPDPFRVSTANKGSVPIDTVDKVNDLLDAAFGPFKDAMAKDFEAGYKKLMKYDDYSTREYLKTAPPHEDSKDPPLQKLDFYTIQWLETNNTSSGLFDQAFSESVIDSFDFASPEIDKVEEWRCIDGGTSLVAKAMEATIKQPIEHCKRVNKIDMDPDSKELIVQVADEPSSRLPYTTVFNTTSLACLQRMDLTGLALHPSQKDAIRALHYDDSAKVAIKFAYPWWITECGITSGGVASTDIPLRTCVYPSYNLHDDPTKPSILLCSYTWAQDATRIGSLVHPDSPKGETELRDLMFDNLARLHAKNYAQNPKFNPPLTLSQIRSRIANAYLSHHAFSWTHDPYTSGAFALFGPGQFSNLYPYLSRPAADARFHFCGEASSAHHAWIVGSLDSAVASVQRFLRRFEMWREIELLKKLWGDVPEVEDDVKGTLHLQVLLGRLPEELMVQV